MQHKNIHLFEKAYCRGEAALGTNLGVHTAEIINSEIWVKLYSNQN